MQRLNELVGLAAAYENAETRKEAFEIVERFNESCGFKSILEIDKAFRAIEQENILLKQGCENNPLVHEMIDWRERAEAAEAECTRLDHESQNLSDQLGACDRERRDLRSKLAELEKQEPVDFRWRWASDENAVWTYCHMDKFNDAVAAFGDNVTIELVYSRPEPAVILTELVNDDTKRMDWLVSKVVNVRQPLPYGSRDILWSQQSSEDCDENYTTDLRYQIDAILRNIEESK